MLRVDGDLMLLTDEALMHDDLRVALIRAMHVPPILAELMHKPRGLVLGTLHTSSAAKTMDRIVGVFPTKEKDMARSMLSESLNAVRNLIHEGKVAQLYSAIQTGSVVGMQTLDQSLTALVQQGSIEAQEVFHHAKYPEGFGAVRQVRWCLQQESNLHHSLRRGEFYPLNYGGSQQAF